MTRKLYPVLFLAVFILAGCSDSKKCFSGGSDSKWQQNSPQPAEYVPENILARTWSQTEVRPEPLDDIGPSPYVTGYAGLDSKYPADEYETWSESNAKRAFVDPVIFIKDIVAAPFKFSRDTYKEYKSKKQCCGPKCDAATDK